LPLAAAVAAWVLARYFIAPGVDLDGMSRGVIGPATWPRFMLYGAALCALALSLKNAFVLVGGKPEGETGSAEPGYHELRSICLIAVIIAYGASLPYIGIAWGTLAFLVAWLLIGGVRRPALLALVPTLGTVFLLYLFVKISLMPLDRGRGVFEEATVALFRFLRIY
jgi:putative tricarboxylic transport membrane protein